MACKDAIQPVARTSVLRLCTFSSMDECAPFSLQRMARHCLVFARVWRDGAVLGSTHEMFQFWRRRSNESSLFCFGSRTSQVSAVLLAENLAARRRLQNEGYSITCWIYLVVADR